VPIALVALAAIALIQEVPLKQGDTRG
jgi:hypothetical protein